MHRAIFDSLNSAHVFSLLPFSEQSMTLTSPLAHIRSLSPEQIELNVLGLQDSPDWSFDEVGAAWASLLIARFMAAMDRKISRIILFSPLLLAARSGYRDYLI